MRIKESFYTEYPVRCRHRCRQRRVASAVREHVISSIVLSIEAFYHFWNMIIFRIVTDHVVFVLGSTVSVNCIDVSDTNVDSIQETWAEREQVISSIVLSIEAVYHLWHRILFAGCHRAYRLAVWQYCLRNLQRYIRHQCPAAYRSFGRKGTCYIIDSTKYWGVWSFMTQEYIFSISQRLSSPGWTVLSP